MKDNNISKDLLEFGAQINQSMDLNFVLEKIIEEESLRLLSTKRATLYLLNEKKDLLIPRATIDPNFKKEAMQEPIPIKNSLSGEVVSTKNGKIFNHASRFSNAYQIPGTPEDDDNEHLLVIPIIIDNQVYGTINFYRSHVQYTEKELELGRIFSMYTSMAIQNAIRNEQLNNELATRKTIEAALLLKNQVFDVSIAANSVANSDGIINQVNKSFLKIWGYKELDEVIGKSIPELMDSKAEATKIIDTLNNTGKWEGDYIAKKKDGTTFNAYGLATILRDKNKNVVGYQSAVIDITDQKEAEEELRNSETKYRNVIEHSIQMFYVHDTNNILSFVSPQSERILGYKPEELFVNWMTIATNNPFNKKGVELTEKAIKTGKRQPEYLLELKRKDGNLIIVKVNESPLKDAQGNVVGITGSLEDVTDMRKYEQELVEKNDRLELFAIIFENLNECITVTDRNHKIFYVNKAFKKLYGYDEEEYLGKTVDFLRIDNDSELLKKIKRATNNGGWTGEIINRKKDGTVFPIELSTTRIYDKEKKIVARIGIVRDITDKKKIEKELNDYQNHLEELVKERTEELEEKNKMLDSSVKVFVGREQTIINLKSKIKELETKLEVAS